MAQKYKVFINHKAVVFAQGADLKDFPNSYEKVKIDFDDDFDDWIPKLKKEEIEKDTVFIYRRNIDLWRIFSSKFKLVEAAGGLVLNPRGKILMIFRKKLWDLPKGKLEYGESIPETAIREVEEETKISDLTIFSEPFITYHTYILDGKSHLKKCYWYKMSSGEWKDPVPQTLENIEQAEWFTGAEAKKNLRKTYPSIREVFDYFSVIS